MGEFVAGYLAEARSINPRPRSDILLIARSVESPVVKAVATHASELLAAGFSVRLIVAQADADMMPRGWSISDTVEIECEVRWARRPPLMEAHEQLVLGPETCWIGDSMRREPAKCDAYETYVDSCSQTTAGATTSFERLWQASEPLLPRLLLPPLAGEQASFARRH